jgi:hypothetical protein
VSPILVARGRAAAGAAGLGPYVEPREVDLNGWSPDRTYHGVMANHSLHHLVELERIFLGVRRCLAPGATFSVNDMIGRNGHMRWPEVLEYVEQVWSFLPREKKYNHQQRTFDDRFQNRDYSHEGFEGIRAQDILPLLVREFGFLQFLPFGGVIDPFIDRGFGHNYDPARKADTELIDGLEELTSNLIDTGRTKPTQMLATLVTGPAPTACWRSWTPAFCVRDPARGPT